ncbi:MAG: lipoyl(octanoyl) transferase LipB [Gammaproteobacteria bacterium]|nr:lipoyl(octanoyl) transferase LipB [Gammaproteobacteria bacterium]
MKLAQKINPPLEELNLRLLGQMDYAASFRAMQDFTNARTPQTVDEIWLLEHTPVFTMGLKGRHGTLVDIHDIPVVYTDRGGDMTYHGPGQLVAYILMDLQRRNWGAKRLVRALEQTVVNLLASYQIRAEQRAAAPGVYVAAGKIAALGLRIRKGASYHGIALNLHMDLTPFSYIDPCGYPGQPVTQLFDLGIHRDMQSLGQEWLKLLLHELGYTARLISSDLPV